jgi:hypothetical protein
MIIMNTIVDMSQCLNNISNPNRAELSTIFGHNLALEETRMCADFINSRLLIAVRQRYRNDSGGRDELRYTLPLDGQGTLLDFQARSQKGTKTYWEFGIAAPLGTQPYSVELGQIDPGEKISIEYLYSMFAKSSIDGRLIMRVPKFVSPARTDGGRRNSNMLFFLRGLQAPSQISVPYGFRIDSLRGVDRVCLDHDSLFEANLNNHFDANKDKLESGEADYGDLSDTLPDYYNPEFEIDFTVVIDKYSPQNDEPSEMSAGLIGNILSLYNPNDSCPANEYLNEFFIDRNWTDFSPPICDDEQCGYHSVEKPIRLSYDDFKSMADTLETIFRENESFHKGAAVIFEKIMENGAEHFPFVAKYMFRQGFYYVLEYGSQFQFWASVFHHCINTFDGWKNSFPRLEASAERYISGMSDGLRQRFVSKFMNSMLYHEDAPSSLN